MLESHEAASTSGIFVQFSAYYPFRACQQEEMEGHPKKNKLLGNNSGQGLADYLIIIILIAIIALVAVRLFAASDTSDGASLKPESSSQTESPTAAARAPSSEPGSEDSALEAESKSD